MTVTAYFNDDTSAPIFGYTYNPYGALTISDKLVTVAYEGKTVTQKITVTAKAVSSIAIITPPVRTAYNIDEVFNPAGMVIIAYYTDNSSSQITDYIYSPDGKLTVSDKLITILYAGKTATQKINVGTNIITGIQITKSPSKTIYNTGDLFNPAGMKVTAFYSDNTKSEVTGYTYSPDGMLSASDKFITVNYAGKTASQRISVREKEFIDVASDAWYYNSVQYVVQAGLFRGTSDTIFEPDAIMTRAMFITVLSRMEYGSDDKVPGGTTAFDDLDQNWYKSAVAWGSVNGIVNGISNKVFSPYSGITREQMVVFLYRYAQYKGYDVCYNENALDVFTDVSDIGDYAKNAMIWAVSNGIINGMTATTLNPQGGATRAQVAAIIMRYVELTK
jgi:hypothetical protein